MKRIASLVLAMVFVCGIAAPVRADVVTDWNEQMLRAALIAGTSPTSTTRVAAMVQAAMFDAVNGINPHYTHIYVVPAASAGASQRAAAMQAAYAMLSKLYGASPANAPQVAFDARRIISLAEIAEDESAASIASGVAWGQSVADQIFLIRSTDGFASTAPFPDNLNIGQWRRTPNLPVSAALSVAGAGYLMVSTQTPWVMTSPMQFRPGPPPAVTTALYAKDFNETKTMGSQFSSARSPELTSNALFWNAGSASYLWNQVALTLIERTITTAIAATTGVTASAARCSKTRGCLPRSGWQWPTRRLPAGMPSTSITTGVRSRPFARPPTMATRQPRRIRPGCRCSPRRAIRIIHQAIPASAVRRPRCSRMNSVSARTSG